MSNQPTISIKPASRFNSSRSEPAAAASRTSPTAASPSYSSNRKADAPTRPKLSRSGTVPSSASFFSSSHPNQERQFKTAAAAALAFPTNTGGPRRRRHHRTLGEFLTLGLADHTDSGTDDGASSVPDDDDQAQLNFARARRSSSLSRTPSPPPLPVPQVGKPYAAAPKPLKPVPPAAANGDIFDYAENVMHHKDLSDQEVKIGMSEMKKEEVPLPPPFVLGKALFDFKPQNAEEQGFLTFSKGDLICITGCFVNTSSWWYGKTAGKDGMFLAYHVERVPVEGETPPDDPFVQPDQRPLSWIDVSSLETSLRISNFDGPAVFRRYDFLHLHLLLDYQRRLRAYELTIEGLFSNPARATNEEYRDIMAALELTLTKYHEALLRYRDLQALEMTSWSDADNWAHAVLPGLPKHQKSSVDAGDFVTPAASGDTFSAISKGLGLERWLSRVILRLHGIDTGSLKSKPLDARYRSAIIQTRSSITRVILSASGAVLLVAPVIAMFFVSQDWQLGILCVATLITALLFSMTRTDPTNILVGTATIAAVLTVFLGQNGSAAGSLATGSGPQHSTST